MGLMNYPRLNSSNMHPVKVAELLSDQPLWSTAQIALYWTMVYNLGNPAKTSTDKSLSMLYLQKPAEKNRITKVPYQKN